MSSQKFTIDERFAFWDAYDKKCIYCGEPITELSSLRIDHLVPEILTHQDHKDDFHSLLEKHNLPKDYDIFSYYNLVASCSKCNGMKSYKTGLAINSIILETARTKVPIIIKKVEIFRKKIAANNINNYSTMPFIFKFRDSIKKGLLSKSKLVDLYDLPVYIGGIEDFSLEGLDGKRPNNPPIINTVSEYINALENGWYPDTTFSIKMSGWFEKARCFLHALERAKLPQISYFSDCQFSFKKLHEFSDMIAYPSYVPTSELDLHHYHFNQNNSLSSYFEYLSSIQTPVKIDKCEDDILSFESESTHFYLEELLRADISGNGYQEILCLLGVQIVGESLGFSNIVLLQKHNPDDLIRYISYSMYL